MFGFIKNKLLKGKFGALEGKLTLTFESLKGEIELLKAWISHLYSRSEDIEQYKQGLTLTQEEVKNLSLWVQYMERRHTEMASHVKSTHGYVQKIHEGHKELFDRIGRLEQAEKGKGQERTTEGTITGQEKDKSFPVFPDVKQLPGIEKTAVIDTDSLTGAQIELLNVLYNYDKPLGYDKIAKYLGKKEKSIRNLIYELRNQGVLVKTKPIGVRKKGFYLDAEEKVRISGR